MTKLYYLITISKFILLNFVTLTVNLSITYYMSPEIKARELLDRFRTFNQLAMHNERINEIPSIIFEYGMRHGRYKQITIIYIDNMLKSYKGYCNERSYWIKVKSKVESLCM